LSHACLVHSFTLFSFFFFHRSLHHCYLHSFPTRRSSDLERQVWDQKYIEYLQKLDEKKPVLESGDYNCAHTEIDLKHPENNHHRSEEHTSELQSRFDLVCRLLLEKKKK